MMGLSDRQSCVLEVIRRSLETRGYPPTLREIGVAMGIRSTNGVNDHLRALERKGYIVRNEQKSRAMVLTERGRDPTALGPFDPRPCTAGVFVQRRRCLRCGSVTFADRCVNCSSGLLEVA